jgi:hypothetical protein
VATTVISTRPVRRRRLRSSAGKEGPNRTSGITASMVSMRLSTSDNCHGGGNRCGIHLPKFGVDALTASGSADIWVVTNVFTSSRSRSG